MKDIKETQDWATETHREVRRQLRVMRTLQAAVTALLDRAEKAERERDEARAANAALREELKAARDAIVGSLLNCDQEMMRRKASQLMGTDGEGWSAGELIHKCLHYLAQYGEPKTEGDEG